MIKTELGQVMIDANNITTILSNLDSLYSNALNQITTYTFGVVALVGVVLPIIISIVQSKSLKSEKEGLEKYLSSESASAKILLKDELSKELKEELLSESTKLSESLEAKLKAFEKQITCADAATFHIQGMMEIEKQRYGSATRDFIYASKRYISGDDELNGQRTLEAIVHTIDELNITGIEEYDLENLIDDLTTFLESENQNKRYTNIKNKITKSLKEAKKRKPANKE